MLRFVVLISLLCAGSTARADFALTHSGMLLDALDQPANDPALDVTFRVVDQAVSVVGEQIAWTATCTVRVERGFYSVTLGDGCGVPLTSTVLPAGAARWLELAVEGQTLSPRLPFGLTPTAVVASHALDADTLGGVASTGFWKKTDDLAGAKLGTGTLGAHTHAAATITGFDAAAVAAVTAAGVPWASVTGTSAATAWPGTVDVTRVTNASTTFAPSAHAHDASAITSGKVANARLHTGSGNGLDADSVDGKHATDFAAATHTHTVAQISDFATAAAGALAGAVIPGSLTTTGLKLGFATACDAEGLLRYNTTTKAVEVCDGTSWKAITSAPSDAYAANVVVLMHFDGSNGSTAFIDQKGHLTSSANATISGTTKKFGTGSVAFTAQTTQYVDVASAADLAMPGDFTIEFFLNVTNPATNSGLLNMAGYLTGLDIRLNEIGAGSGLYFNTNWFAASTSVPSANVWHHLAIVRSGNNGYYFLDGAQVGSTFGWSGKSVAQGVLRVGNIQDGGTGGRLNGWIDELRVTKGVARYTSTFTPPTSAFE